MAEYSFDTVCKVDRQELSNAVGAAEKEVHNRFDFKGIPVKIDLGKDTIHLEVPDEMKMKQLTDILQTKILRRGLNLKAFTFGSFETNVSGVVKCLVTIQNGLDQEQCKKINRLIKESKLKVQSRIQGDAVRVSGKKKNDLQAVQKIIQEANFDFAAVFENYR